MRIYSMTATFGKLQNETLTLEPGLNIIERPNEWGKSTWCAFILAMFYGIDTSSRSKKDFLAEKERYAPWSGAPMSGRMDLCWKGRNITIERSTKGRSIFGVFKAYETESGLPVPELTGANCGEQLLGVEQSVFARAGFLRLKDMPVTQDESLRRRLNALVTTGDDSGAADDLAGKLKELKNRCRFNRTGLLPQAEAQERELTQKLQEMESLQQQVEAIENRIQALKTHQQTLENHKQALRYEEDRNFAGKLAMNRAQLEIAQDRVASLESVCAELPSPMEVEGKLRQLQQLQDEEDALQMDIQLQPPPPGQPPAPAQFQGVEPQDAPRQAAEDAEEFRRLLRSRKPNRPLWILGVILIAVSALTCALVEIWLWEPFAIGLGLIALAILLFFLRKRKNEALEREARAIARKYSPIEPDCWVSEAQRWADTCFAYRQSLEAYRKERMQKEHQLWELRSCMGTLTRERSPSRFMQEMETVLQQHKAYGDALRERSRMQDLVETLESTHREVLPPEMPDSLTFTREETERLLSDGAEELRQLHQRSGQYQGRMEALGDAGSLRLQREKIQARIRQLEQTCGALSLAQETLERAKQELQRRFAPRIAKRAQELFGLLTEGRYQRIALGEDFAVSTAAEGEDTLRSSLWRSDGTADQLYLALRLAVAEELTPNAPLVLDDAFVRFDDSRLQKALDLINQSGRRKQVLLFTCQSREQKIMEELL